MAEESHATWGGRFREGPSELMQSFSESVSFDSVLAQFDIRCSRAHSAMLCHVGLIDEQERDTIHAGLEAISQEIAAGTFSWDERLEDVHMNIEQRLTERIPAAAKLHTARSRNDQVATDMRLFFKAASTGLQDALSPLLLSLLDLADASKDVMIPSYTHLQRAQPVSAAHHLMAYVEMFGRDMERAREIGRRANWCPLGSGAVAGTTLPIDREFVAKELGFVDEEGRPQVTRNSMDTVADRDLFIEFASACCLAGIHLSRVAEDMILWASSEFGYVSLPEAFTTGSSLMPQKKNPDALELIRGKSARLAGNLQTLVVMTKGLPLTYNRDLQEDKPPVFDSFQQTLQCLNVLTEVIRGTRFRAERCRAAVSDPALLATDVVDYLVRKGVAFRDAHHLVGKMVALAEDRDLSLKDLPLKDLQGIDEHFDEEVYKCFDIDSALSRRERTGMPGPQQVERQIAFWRKQLT